ncbi:C39 family peptidase [Micromonospora yangpuensis]|uniref:Peptidase_C39 like family protein n=1 Tax=Micromonospora yangpuensis TaxID=683228 RepID=A0A1C6UGK9_9ACTN|nr:C39 family peptidase [Micromonospora yangpuensis]GGM05126.1 hypothetical protein GCM10012279_23540 [Micromonospora yangpuensis]SCL53023.1 Peptidase_C39 like family protein [Micromonospora yangpuensis]
MPHPLKRQFRRLAVDRSYQVVAASAATLVVASGTGLLIATGDRPEPDRQQPSAVAEVAPQAGEIAARSELRVPASVAPSLTTAAPSPTATASPSAASPSAASPSAASPSAAPSRAAKPVAAASSAAPDPDLTRPAAPKPPASKVLDHVYQAQTTYFYCGPAAVRNALNAAGIERSQDTLAGMLGTTEFGTNSAADTTRVLNQLVDGAPYRTRMIPGGAATAAQTDRLVDDVVTAIAAGRSPVVNIAGTATDVAGGWHSFPGGHYVAVVGYRDNGRTVRISDSADPGNALYWMSTSALADWIATRGYSA